MATARITVDVAGIPEALASMRRELAGILRTHATVLDAAGTSPTTDDLRDLAAMFEAGQESKHG